MYSIIYNPSNVPVKGYHPKGSLFRVDKRKFGVRVAISFPTELEAIAVIQHIETLATKEEVATFVKDLKEGGIRIITESGDGVEVVDEKVDIVEEDSVEVEEVEEVVEVSEEEALKDELASLRQQVLDRDIELDALRSNVKALEPADASSEETYKTKFEFLENVTGGVRKFTDLKNSFAKRLKFLFFPNKY